MQSWAPNRDRGHSQAYLFNGNGNGCYHIVTKNSSKEEKTAIVLSTVDALQNTWCAEVVCTHWAAAVTVPVL